MAQRYDTGINYDNKFMKVRENICSGRKMGLLSINAINRDQESKVRLSLRNFNLVVLLVYK